MKAYLIVYDLNSVMGVLNSANIEATIKSLGQWAKLMNNVWLLYTSLPRDVVSKKFGSLISETDRFIVFEVDNRWNSYNLPTEIVNWMHNNLK